VVIATLPEEIARAEPHQEIRDLLGWSIGLNIGLGFVPGALATDFTAPPPEGAEWAAEVVWFDSLITNPDRTPRNANMIVHEGRSWLIDHGSALYIHHSCSDPDAHARRPFERIADHVLLPFATSMADADARLSPRVDASVLDGILASIPDEWLGDGEGRDAYRDYLLTRLGARPAWVGFADAARGEVQRGAVA